MKTEWISTYIIDDGNKEKPYKSILNGSSCVMHSIPRECSDFLDNSEELRSVAFYILLGYPTLSSKRKAYIGQTTNFYNRVKQHDSLKPFWSTAICFTSTPSLTKEQVQYLEYLAIRNSIENNTYELLENCQIPSKPYIDKFQESTMDDFFKNCITMLENHGIYIFTKMDTPKEVTNSHTIINRIAKKYKSKPSNSYMSSLTDEELEEMESNIFQIGSAKYMKCDNGDLMIMSGSILTPSECLAEYFAKDMIGYNINGKIQVIMPIIDTEERILNILKQ